MRWHIVGVTTTILLSATALQAQAPALQPTGGEMPPTSGLYYCGFIDGTVFSGGASGQWHAQPNVAGQPPEEHIILIGTTGKIVAAWYQPLDNLADMSKLHFLDVKPKSGDRNLLILYASSDGNVNLSVRIQIHLLCRV